MIFRLSPGGICDYSLEAKPWNPSYNQYKPQKFKIDTQKWPYSKGVHIFQTFMYMVSMLVFRYVSQNFLHSKIRAFERCPKMNLEPKNHPIEKEIPIFQTIILGIHVTFQGCIVKPLLVSLFFVHRTLWGWKSEKSGCLKRSVPYFRTLEVH